MTPPATAAAHTVHRGVPAARRVAVRHPRRVSGAAVERPSSGALLDRLIRGRIWIGALAFALIGIVAMQLLVLELNNRIGHTLQRQVGLERENAQLAVEGSEASSGSLVEPQAAAAGMTLAPAGALRFLAAAPADVRRAAGVLSSPIQASSESTAQTAPSPAGGETNPSAAPGSGTTSGSETMPGSGTTSGSETPSGSGTAPGSGTPSGSETTSGSASGGEESPQKG